MTSAPAIPAWPTWRSSTAGRSRSTFFTSRLDLEDHSGRAIVAAIIALAHALQMEVVAEGVETEGQLRELQLLHCDQVQGFLLGRPAGARCRAVNASNDDLFAGGAFGLSSPLARALDQRR
jgi:predicted signal transduction protein with EAL and GGDEF domain